MEPLKVALTFVEAINSGRAGELAALMTADHVFVDSDGTEVSGRERMREGWESYFAMVPDFRIEVERHVRARRATRPRERLVRSRRLARRGGGRSGGALASVR